jgi:hypothetical protein
MLRPNEVADLRQKALASQKRRAFDGLRVRLLRSEAAYPCVGFCAVTARGPVQGCIGGPGPGDSSSTPIPKSEVES